MPVRSLGSSVLVWPGRAAVEAAARAWTREQARGRPDLLALGAFGSYARGDASVGSDLDLVAVVAESALPFERRACAWDLLDLPVPAQLLVYTAAEWRRMQAEGGRFARTLSAEALWLVGSPP